MCICLIQGGISHILCQAISQPDGALVAVLEILRREDEDRFHEEDEEIAYSYLVWGGIALHYAHLFLSMNKQRKLNDFLLAVVKYVLFKFLIADNQTEFRLIELNKFQVNFPRYGQHGYACHENNEFCSTFGGR